MPGLSGIESTRHIKTASPDTAVLVLSMFDDDDSVFAAIQAVARGEAVFGAAIADRVLGLFTNQPTAHVEPFPQTHPPRTPNPGTARPRATQRRNCWQRRHHTKNGTQPRQQHLHQASSTRPNPSRNPSTRCRIRQRYLRSSHQRTVADFPPLVRLRVLLLLATRAQQWVEYVASRLGHPWEPWLGWSRLFAA